VYIGFMSIREYVLEAALRICRRRGGWTFGPGEIVAALPDLNGGSVRTHVMSRCCVNAPAHHVHRWPFFRRIRRGEYEILPAWRSRRRPGAEAAGSSRRDRARAAFGHAVGVREPGVSYAPGPERPDPVLAAYEKEIDRTLILRRLRLSFEERLLALESWMKDIEVLKGAARRPGGRPAK
jgi:hypothetical protein